MGVSPDDSLKSDSGTNIYGMEIKSPEHIHEQVTKCYVLQNLAQTEALEVNQNLFVSWTKESCRVFPVTHDPDLFNDALE